ncbi:unnamed protein product [Ectocarpus sp. 12 AP-2014]
MHRRRRHCCLRRGKPKTHHKTTRAAAHGGSSSRISFAEGKGIIGRGEEGLPNVIRGRSKARMSRKSNSRVIVSATAVLGVLVGLLLAEGASAQQVGNLTGLSRGYSVNLTGSSLNNPFDDTSFNQASAIGVSADGTGVYVGGELGGLIHLARSPEDGSLTMTRAWAASDFDEALQSVEQIVVTPDGSKLITLGSRGLGSGTFGVFSISADGDLQLLQEDDHRGIIRAGFPDSSSRDLYAIDDDRSVLTHYTYDGSRFVVSQTVGGFTCLYGLGVAPDGANVYVADDCLYTVTNFRRDPDTGSLTFQDELSGDPRNGDGLGCLKSLSFTEDGAWVVGLDSCDDVISILKRDLDTGTLTPTTLINTDNPDGNTINIDKTWSALVVSDGLGDIYVADWSDSKIFWVRADFGVGGDGSVISTNWFSLSFKPSTLIASPDLQTVYVANKENDVWEGGAYPRVAVPTPDSDGSGTSAVNVTLAVALSVSLVAAIVIVGVAAKVIQRKRNISMYAGEEETLRAALEANPNDAVAHNNLGYLMETVYKDFAEAEAHYSEALRINPRAAFAHNSLGHLLHHRQKDYDAAEEHYLKAINLHWRSPDAHYNLGCLLQHHKGDVAEAEKQYRHAIKCDPKHGMAQYNLGWVLEKVKQDLKGAEACYRAAIAADPEDKDAARRLAKVVAQMQAEEEGKH